MGGVPESPATLGSPSLAFGLGTASRPRIAMLGLRYAPCAPAFSLKSLTLMPNSHGISRAHSVIAGGLGFEPRFTASKAAVLPLDDPPI